MWSLDADEDAVGEAIRMLMVSLAKPPLTDTEVTWKKGACASLLLTNAARLLLIESGLFLVPMNGRATHPAKGKEGVPRPSQAPACRQAAGQPGGAAAWQPGQEGVPLLRGR